MQVIKVSKQSIYPAFGLYSRSTNTAEIRDDLPMAATNFVIAHEQGHADGRGEIMATLMAIPKHPIGFIITVFMSLAPYRLAYYWRRLNG